MKTKIRTDVRFIRRFIQSVAEFSKAELRQAKAKAELERQARTSDLSARKKMQYQIDAVLPKALANVCKLIRQDSDFSAYLISLFGGAAAHSVADDTGVCGFPIPPMQIVGNLQDRSIKVLVLDLYSEYESKRRADSVESRIEDRLDGESQTQNGAVLALTALPSTTFGVPEIDQAKNCRLIIADERTDDSLCISTYSKLSSTPLDPGFVSTLRKLSSPKSTFQFFLKKFGARR